ncbi:MAG: hypothetical protein K6T99_05480 [Armatimonadetes bacterium]|nr:hypothetical protein [Armatimonadota bacterium]
MKQIMLFLAIIPACVYARDVYQVRRLSEHELLKTYENIMLDCCRFSDRDWHESAFDVEAGYWGNGISEGNEGIRAIGNMVLSSAALLKYSRLKDAERQYLKSRALRAIRYAVATHVTGTQKCTDGKKWGCSWQSGMWASNLAFGAWLIWDDLDNELREGIERVISKEADRLLNRTLPTNRWGDTKAEENGWDLTCISIASNMFARHPNASEWSKKAIEYMMNTLSVPRDLRDERLIDGRPVKEWVKGANLHPDFTLENHNFFHPSYVACSSYFLAVASMHYAYARRPIPQAATHHLMDTWAMFQTLVLPCGETIFPQGMDWELHGLPYINLFAFLSTKMHDSLAARLESIHLQYIRTWQNMQDGNLAIPGSKLGFTRHAIFAEQVTYGFLSHKLFGPACEPNAATRQLECVRQFGPIGVILHRTPSKLVSFSWKNRIMGTLAPIGEKHEGNCHFAVPITNGFIGTFQLGEEGSQALTVVKHSWRKAENGFETFGELLTNGGLLKQELKVTSVGEKVVVYEDKVTALDDVLIESELGVPVGIENDILTGGLRTVYHQGGKINFDWRNPQKPVAFHGKWVNVDGRLGVVSVAGSGIAYVQATAYNSQAVYADTLYGSFSNRRRQFKAGDQIAYRLIVFFVETTPEETSLISESVMIKEKPEGRALSIKLYEGKELQVPLM